MIRYLLAISLLLSVTIATAQTTTVLSAQVYRTVNVRSGPGTQYAIIGRLSGGMEVSVTGRSDSESNWLAIDFDGQAGWVAFFTVTLNGDPQQLPIIEPQTPPPLLLIPAQSGIRATEAVTNVYITVFRRVNVRSGPGADAERLGTLFPGRTADIRGRTADNQWLLIDYNGESGWVAYFVVTITGELDTIPVYDAETAVLTSLSTGNRVSVLTRFNINLRVQPTATSPVLTIIPFATELDVEARTLNRSWLRVVYNGEVGWIMTNLVIVGDGQNLADLPIAE